MLDLVISPARGWEAVPHGERALCPLRRSGRRLPAELRARRGSEDRGLPRRPDRADPGGARLHSGRAARQRLRRARPAGVPRGRRPHADGDLRQGWAGLGLRARAAERRRRHLAAVLARLPDRRADREGAEPEACPDRRDRVRPRRPAGGDRSRGDGRRGHLLEQHQRRRARRDDDPGTGSQLHPLLWRGHRGRLEHRRLRLPLLRPRGNAGRDGRRGADRLGGACVG